MKDIITKELLQENHSTAVLVLQNTSDNKIYSRP